MLNPVDTRNPQAVGDAVRAIYMDMFPKGDLSFVHRALGWLQECFNGSYGNYQAIDADYHDLEHTLQGTLCLARLLHARFRAQAEPHLDQRMFQLGLVAILLHDSGYLKTRSDVEGTGAKYTVIHVSRSAEFAGRFLFDKGFTDPDIRAVQNMIGCTGVNSSPATIPFQEQTERITGYALATADLLGQMAADDYVDKLPTLYEEFAEAKAFSRDAHHFIAGFSSAVDLMRKTPAFWRTFVLPKLEFDFEGLHRFLNDPYPAGPNPYVERIERNIARLEATHPVSP